MSPRKNTQVPDKMRGKRLQEERKKIFKTQKEFTNYGSFSGTSVTRWEGEGLDIPSSALQILANRGADIHYILTGDRSSGGLDLEVSRTFTDKIKELEGRISELQEMLNDKREIINLKDTEIETLKSQLSNQGQKSG